MSAPLPGAAMHYASVGHTTHGGLQPPGPPSLVQPQLVPPPIISLPHSKPRDVNPHKPMGKRDLTASFLPPSCFPKG